MKGKLLIVAIAGVIALSGCASLVDKVTGAQTKVAAVAQAIQPGLIPACGAAMAVAGMAGPVAPWIIAGCATAEAVDKLAADPSSTQWVNQLIGQAETVVSAAKGS